MKKVTDAGEWFMIIQIEEKEISIDKLVKTLKAAGHSIIAASTDSKGKKSYYYR